MVVSVAKTVVYVGAVVVELLNAGVAEHAVEGLVRLYYEAVEAEVFQVDILLISKCQQVLYQSVARSYNDRKLLDDETRV